MTHLLAPSSSATTRGRRRALDVVVTGVLMLALAPLALVATFYGMWSGATYDGCDAGACLDVLDVSVAVLTTAPVLLCGVTLLVVLDRAHDRRPTWWVPVVSVATWLGLLATQAGVVAVLG